MTQPQNTRKFGVEIEFVGIDRHSLASHLNQAGIYTRVESYNHQTRPHWKITTDASVSGRGGAGELVSPILKGQEGLEQLRQVCAVLNEHGATVNRTCGLHVHLDARDLNVEQIKSVAKRYHKYQSSINSIMPPSRVDGTYCNRLSDQQIARLERSESKYQASNSWGKFHVVNISNIDHRGSIEFRQHSGTVDYIKISRWIIFLQQFLQKSIELQNTGGRSVMKSRAFSHARQLLEQSGYEVKHRRYRDDWSILSDGEQVAILDGDDLRNSYDEMDSSKRRRAFVNPQKFDAMLEAKGLRLSAVPLADQGWLDGVDGETQEYIRNRIRQLS